MTFDSFQSILDSFQLMLMTLTTIYSIVGFEFKVRLRKVHSNFHSENPMLIRIQCVFFYGKKIVCNLVLLLYKIDIHITWYRNNTIITGYTLAHFSTSMWIHLGQIKANVESIIHMILYQTHSLISNWIFQPKKRRIHTFHIWDLWFKVMERKCPFI